MNADAVTAQDAFVPIYANVPMVQEEKAADWLVRHVIIQYV